jgi:hypothetical protein
MVTVIFKNFGRTPVWLVEASTKLTCEPRKPGEFPPTLKYDPPFVLPNSELVPPEHTASRGLELRPLTYQEIEQIKIGKQLLFVYGFIKYRDAFFDQTKILRETWFCKRYMFLGPADEHWVDFGPKGASHNT